MPLVVRYLAERAERLGDWDPFDAVPLMDHVEKVDDEFLLLALAVARFTPRGRESAEGMARSFDLRFGLRLRGRGATFWSRLAYHLADAAGAHHDLVFGGVFKAWFDHAPVLAWLDWLQVVQDRARGEPRAHCLAASLRRLAVTGGVEEALARLHEDGERLAAELAMTCAPGTEPWRHALAPGGLRLSQRQVELYLSLGLALLGAPFAQACIDSGRVSPAAVNAVPDMPLADRLSLLRRRWPWAQAFERTLPPHPLRLALAAASLADVAAALRAQPADDFGAELAVFALHRGAAAGNAAQPLMRAAWEALLRCLEYRTRDDADDLVSEAAPALGALFNSETLGRMGADIYLCDRWWP